MGRHGKMMRGRVPAAPQGNEWAAASPAKSAALRPYMTAGIALVGASVIAVSPVTPSLPGLPVEQPVTVEQPATRLLASVANIPANLLIMVANIPYYESLALQEYAYALGPSFEEAAHPEFGGVPGWVPLSATVKNGGLVVGPDGKEYYRRGGTGSWWRQSPTGNTWGWEDGNWPQMAAIAHVYPPDGVRLAHRPTIGGFRGGRVHRWSQRQLRVQLCRRTGLPGTLAHVLNAAHRPACRNHPLPQHR